MRLCSTCSVPGRYICSRARPSASPCSGFCGCLFARRQVHHNLDGFIKLPPGIGSREVSWGVEHFTPAAIPSSWLTRYLPLLRCVNSILMTLPEREITLRR